MVAVAIVGVALGSGALGLACTLTSRRRLRRLPDVFVCRVRAAGPLDGTGWSGRKRYAHWVHDVLLVHRGVTLVRCDALPVAQVTGPAIGPAVTRLGERPVLLRLHLDDGRQVELAAQNGDIVPASGPFRASTRT